MRNRKNDVYLTPSGNHYRYIGWVRNRGTDYHAFRLIHAGSVETPREFITVPVSSHSLWLNSLKLVGVNYRHSRQQTEVIE